MTHSDSIWVEALEQHMVHIQGNIDSLRIENGKLQYKTEFLSNVVETANDGVSNQLASATLWLEVIAIIIALAGVVLGFYISYKKRQIENLATTVEAKKQEVERIARETEKLDQKINNDIEGLYKRLRREETKTWLERLVQEPRDISNIGALLYARDIDDDFYNILREAYLKYQNEEDGDVESKNSYLSSYMGHFFQHFAYFALRDDNVRPALVEDFPSSCSAAFPRDIIKTTMDLCRALSDESSSFNKEDVLVKYLKALNNSQYSTFSDVKNILEQNITQQTLLKNAIERCTNDKCYLSMFDILPPDENKREE